MHASAFNLYINDFPTAGQLMVHNSFSGAYVVLDEREAAVLRQAESGEPLDAEALALIEAEEWLDPDVGIIVESLQREHADYQAWFARQRAGRELQAIVCTNLSCNFDCPYCCQAEVMDGSVMSFDVLEKTADWLAERAQRIDAERVQLLVVGGEPLLYPLRIKTLVARLTSRLEPHGIEVVLGLITNGYFMSEELVRELLPYGLVHAQVTLDGDRTTHCKSRVSKRDEDTFDRIFNNVIAASRHIHIALNGNYQEHTVSGFAPLIDELAKAGMASHHTIAFAPAFEVLSTPAGGAGGACDWTTSPHRYRIALHDRIVAAGFQTTDLNSVGPCGFHSHHLLAIDPAGNLFKCPGFLGHPEWRIGHVESGLTERYQQMIDWNFSSSCGSCAHRPNCGGSCVADEMMRTGALQVMCEKEYFDEAYLHAVPRKYLLASHEDVATAVANFPAPPVQLPQVSGTRLPQDRLAQPEPLAGLASELSPELQSDIRPRAVRSAALRVL